MNELMPFVYQDVRLKESCWIDRKPYFTRRAIGEWLGYVKPRPDVAIAKIVAKNPHILQFATVTNLVTVEGTREVTREIEVYDPIGLQLIVMESRQPKAIAYKIAVAHLVAAYMRGEVVPAGVRRIAEPPTIEGLAMTAPYTRGKGKAIVKLALEYGRCPNTIRRYIRNVKEGKPIRLIKEPDKLSYVHIKHRGVYEQAISLYLEGMKAKDIAQRLKVPLKTIYRWI